MKRPLRYTVTAALPYANGPVHIGHLAGCYLPSDIYVRFLRLKGEDVLYVCGSDEHGVAITLKAKQEGITPQQLVDKYHEQIRESFAEFGISFNVYSRTSLDIHHKTAADFFKLLHEKGVFTRKKSVQYYDVKFEQFLADRYIFGTCPNCGYEKAYGDQCEKCGKSLDPSDLINPKSVLSGETPEKRETEHWYLPLQKYEGWLKEWVLDNHKDWKPNVVGQVRSWITQGLQERSVTRDLDWGVKVPLADAEGKVLYVWFDAPIGYISATKAWAQERAADWEPYWQDEGTKLVHFIGKDNIVFHCIIFPVMLKEHGDYILPENVPANEFLNIEGEKVSTSRNWAVWLHEYLKDFPGKQDVLRYVLTSIAPETKDSDFTWKDFQARNNNELAAIFGNLVNRVITLTHKYFDGNMPSKGNASEAEDKLEEAVKAFPDKIAALLHDYKFREAQQEMMNLCRLGNKYLTDQEPWKLWKTDQERVATILHYSLQLLANIAIVCDPFLPDTSQKLRQMLDLESEAWDDAGSMKLLKDGKPIGQGQILFEQIPDEVIDEQIQKLNSSTAGAKAATEVPPFKENITFDDFSKMDLRIATILEAERVPKTDKLLKLQVDLGSEQRNVVSGIAEFYKPEDIIGRQVCMIVNLEPRKIKGITSQGMLLMIENDQKELVFLNPERQVNSGAGIS